MAQLLVLAGDGTERTFDLAEAPVVCGRQEDNDIVLKEAKASRRHCTFRPWRGGWRIVDEGSSNGTFLGGKPVLSARLQPGDEIEIGDTIITFAAQASEMPKAATIRERRVRRVPIPWGVMVGAAALTAAAFVFSLSYSGSRASAEAAAWKSAAHAEVARAALSRSDDEFRTTLADAAQRMRAQPEAVKLIEAAAARGLLRTTETGPAPEWKRALSKLDASKARMGAGERRWQLRELLVRHLGDKAAVQTITESLVAEDTAARERAEADAARQKEDAADKAKQGRLGPAIEAWQQWFASAPHVTRDEEKALAATLADLREQSRKEADKAVALYGDHVKEGRLAAAGSAVDGAIERLRGSGYDAWIAARTRRNAGAGDAGPGRPSAESDAERQAKMKEQRLQRALRSAEDLAGKRKFADAAVLLREASGEITDPKLAQLKADVDARIADLSAEADLVGWLLVQVKAEPAHFNPLAPLGPQAKVVGATETGLVVETKSAVTTLQVTDLPGPAFQALLEKAKLEPPQFVPAGLLMRDLVEPDSFTAWMRKALDVDAVRNEASIAYARVRGEKLPDGGYMPHPKDPAAIVTYAERRRIDNEATITAQTAKLRKVVDRIEATKQGKAVARVAESFVKLDAARDHALELIFDEVKYFYPYKTRQGEYAPVQLEVDKRVRAVRDLWDDKSVEKIRPDSTLTKLLEEAEGLRVDIAFYMGDVTDLVDRIDRIKRYMGRDLTVRNFFVTEADLALLESNEQVMAYNAKLKADVTENERDQVRITNEYRKMMGHRRMLRIHDKLVAAARGHSKDMESEGFFDHFSPLPGKREPGDRMKLAGYPNTPCSENIAMCGGAAQSAFDSWYSSSGHHRNMLMQGWSELGAGQSGRLWTQNFGFCTGDDQAGGTGPR